MKPIKSFQFYCRALLITVAMSATFCTLSSSSCNDPDDDEPYTPIPSNPSNGNNGNNENNGNNDNNGNDNNGNGGNQSDVSSYYPKAVDYSIDGVAYKTIRVSGGPMPDFYIMQTELPPNSFLRIGSKYFGTLNTNGDNGVIKTEFKNFLNSIRTETGIPFRLPTREEWQYAAKGGNMSKGYTYSGSNTIGDVAWYKGNAGGKAHDVARNYPNELGLYDMSGNYGEVCNETDDIYYIDGYICGGSWKDAASDCKPTSWKNGDASGGKIPGTTLKEKNAFDARYITVRLVYSAQ